MSEATQPLRLLGYCRVSTANQREEGTIEIQERALADFAAAQRHDLVGIHRDDGVSGARDLDNRPGLAAALDALEADPTLDGLLIWKLDRLARDLYVQEYILRELVKRGKALVSVHDGAELLNNTDPMRTAFRQFMGIVSQLEKAFITMRLSAGRVNKARKGGYAGGRRALGYAVKDGDLRVLEAEAAVVRTVYALRADGLTVRQIAAKLDALGARTMRGGPWRSSTVHGILGNPKYRGTMKYRECEAPRADLDILTGICSDN
jgi:site-specific DNA recombinase